MYSEAFFLYLKDSVRHFNTNWSEVKIEHELFKELKSDWFKELRKTYIEEEKEFPSVKLTNCPIFKKNFAILVKNNAIQYSPADN